MLGEVTKSDTGERSRVLRALHAEGAKRGLEHGDLRRLSGRESLGDLNIGELKTLFREIAGRNLGRRRKTPLPKRGCLKSGLAEMVTPEDIETLGNAFAARGWGTETQRAFIRRQLGGREQVRTRGEFWRVFSGVRAMNRRDGK